MAAHSSPLLGMPVEIHRAIVLSSRLENDKTLGSSEETSIIRALSSTCSALFDSLRDLRYDLIHIRGRPDETEIIEVILSRPFVAGSVKRLCVSGEGGTNDPVALRDLVKQMVNLKMFACLSKKPLHPVFAEGLASLPIAFVAFSGTDIQSLRSLPPLGQVEVLNFQAVSKDEEQNTTGNDDVLAHHLAQLIHASFLTLRSIVIAAHPFFERRPLIDIILLGKEHLVFPSLKTIVFPSMDASSRTMVDLLGRCPNLKDLDCDRVSSVEEPETSENVLSTSLVRLSLSSTTATTELSAFDPLFARLTSSFRFEQLRVLKLDGYLATPEQMLTLGEALVQLRELFFISTCSGTIADFAQAVTSFKSLDKLVFSALGSSVTSSPPPILEHLKGNGYSQESAESEMRYWDLCGGYIEFTEVVRVVAEGCPRLAVVTWFVDPFLILVWSITRQDDVGTIASMDFEPLVSTTKLPTEEQLARLEKDEDAEESVNNHIYLNALLSGDLAHRHSLNFDPIGTLPLHPTLPPNLSPSVELAERVRVALVVLRNRASKLVVQMINTHNLFHNEPQETTLPSGETTFALPRADLTHLPLPLFWRIYDICFPDDALIPGSDDLSDGWETVEEDCEESG